MNFRLLAMACAISFAAGPVVAQQSDLKSLPGGSLMLKDVPSAQGNVQNLPGVNLNMRAQAGNGQPDCSDRQVYSLGVGTMDSGTLTECRVGNFTFSSARPSGGMPSTWTEGVPSPFGSNFGPPPGSGGFAPRPSNGLW